MFPQRTGVEFAELLARIRSLLRRGSGSRETVLVVGDLSVDLIDRRVTRAGRSVELRPREYEMLVYLLRRKCFASVESGITLRFG